MRKHIDHLKEFHFLEYFHYLNRHCAFRSLVLPSFYASIPRTMIAQGSIITIALLSSSHNVMMKCNNTEFRSSQSCSNLLHSFRLSLFLFSQLGTCCFTCHGCLATNRHINGCVWYVSQVSFSCFHLNLHSQGCSLLQIFKLIFRIGNIRYLKERKQFGAPLASFQINQQKLVHMLGNIQAMILVGWRLCKLYENRKMTPGHASLGKVNAANPDA